MSRAELSLLNSANRRTFLSPQPSHRSTELKMFSKPTYSPISTIQRDSVTKTTIQHSEPSIQINLHRDTTDFQQRRASYNEAPYGIQAPPKLETKSVDDYDYYQSRETRETRDTRDTRSRSPNPELNAALYRILQEKEEGLRRHEAVKKETGIYSLNNTQVNLNRNPSAFLYMDLLSPTCRTTVSHYQNNKTTNSKAYSKAMKALQDRVFTLEDEIKERSKRRKNDEWLEQSLQEAEKRNTENEAVVREMEREKKMWTEHLEAVEREKEEYRKEREAVLREKEAFMRDKEQWMKEKDEWIKSKEETSRKIYEAEKAKEEAERRNKTLEETIEKLEKENAEQKRTYHQHLKSLVLKNDALVLEVTNIKEYYDNQIKEFTQELVSIEEEHSKKIEDYEKTIEELKKQNKESQDLAEIRRRSNSQVNMTRGNSRDMGTLNGVDKRAASSLFREVSPLASGSNVEAPLSTKMSLFENYEGDKKSQMEGLLTPTDKLFEMERVSRMGSTSMVGDRDRMERKESKAVINRELSDEINKYLRIEDSQNEKNVGLYKKQARGYASFIGDDRPVGRNEQETAQFKKSESFGGSNTLFSRMTTGDIRDASSPKRLSSVAEALYSGSDYKGMTETRSPLSRSLRGQLLDKERELSELNEKYQEMLKKIQDNTNGLERSKMRSQLIGLTDEIQKTNDQIYQLRKQESQL